jgi:hypothetical protein
MHKRKALMLSILCAVLAFSADSAQQFTVMWIVAACSLLCFSIWFYKYQRDKSIVIQARLEREQAAQVSHTLPQTSKGSRRLFVPPPIN